MKKYYKPVKTVIRRAYGLTAEEISTLLGIKPNKIYRLHHNRKLKKLLNQQKQKMN